MAATYAQKNKGHLGYEVVSSDVLTVLFVWFGLVLFTGVGNLSQIELREISQFSAIGTIVLTLAGAFVPLLRASAFWLRVMAFGCAVFLVFLPCFVLSLDKGDRPIMLDLYFVFLVAVPVLLNLWDWRRQALLGVAAVIAVTSAWIQAASWSALHSILLIVLASFLSTLVMYFRARQGQYGVSLRYESERLLREIAESRLQKYCWNVLFLEGALLLVLLFLDISLFGTDQVHPLRSKAYGLIVVVLCGFLFSASSAEQLPRRVAHSTVLLGIILSLSRLGYGEAQNVYLVLPLLYLILVATSLPWSLMLQTSVVWTLVFGDLFVRVIAWMRLNRVSVDAFGEVLHQYRAEIGLLALGAVISVIAAQLRQRHRLSELSQVTGAQDQPAAADGKTITLQHNSKLALAKDRIRRLLLWQFVLGIISSAVSTSLVLVFGQEFWWVALLSWIGFTVAWGVLQFAAERNMPEQHLWTLGVVTQLGLILWPCILLLMVPEVGMLWMYWPIAVMIGVGAIPWSAREYLPLLLAALVVGGEMIHKLSLNAYAVFPLVAVALLAMWSTINTSRRLREKGLLLCFEEVLGTLQDEPQVLRALADYLCNLFNADGAVTFVPGNSAELVIAPHAHEFEKGDMPLGRIYAQAREVPESTPGLTVRSANWLPGDLCLRDPTFGVISFTNCLIVQLTAETKGGLALVSRSRRYELFLLLNSPFSRVLQYQELRAAMTLIGIARMKLQTFVQEVALKDLAKNFKEKGQEREYELTALVHDINNTVQDLTLLCESIVEDSFRQNGYRDASGRTFIDSQQLMPRVRRIEGIARSVATVVSDAKRRRELEQLDDLRPRELVEVNSVVKEVLSFSKLRGERKRITVEGSKLPLEEVWVKVSVREHLESILRNLLNNAIIYSPAGSKVALRVGYDDFLVSIEVVDDGPGLSKQECVDIFERGVRGRQGSDVRGGLGVGLAESRRVAESAGGCLVANSDGSGSGSVFTLSLPRHPAPRRVAHGEPWALLVDDEPPLVDFYARLAAGLRLQPVMATSLQDAVAILEKRGQPTLVITDIALGGSDGLDLVRYLRSTFGSTLPILVISGLPDNDIAERARAAGASDFVHKPVGRRALFARIQSLLPQ